MKPFALPTKTLVALSLAIGLGGCSGLTGLLAGTGLGLSGRSAIDAGAALTADALAAVNSDEDLDRAAAVARAASYTAQSLEGTASAEAKASAEATASADAEAGGSAGSGCATATTSLEAQYGAGSGLALRIERLEKRMTGQIEALKKLADIEPPVTTTHADGTVTTRFELTIARAHNTTHMTATKTVGADGKVILLTYDAEKSNKSGHGLTIHRERRINLDGTWNGAFESKLTRKDGRSKTVKWTVVGAVDGSEQAEGTITRFDGSVVTIAITRSAEGAVVVVTRDVSARISAEARKAELETTAEVRVVSEADGKTLETVTISDTTEVEVSDR